jgi:hypothetical protein
MLEKSCPLVVVAVLLEESAPSVVVVLRASRTTAVISSIVMAKPVRPRDRSSAFRKSPRDPGLSSSKLAAL